MIRFKTILTLAVVIYVGFMAIKIVPARADDREMEYRAAEITKYFSTREGKKDDKWLHYLIWQQAQHLWLPVTEEAINAKDEDKEWHVWFTYKREIPLVFWAWKEEVTIDARGQK